MSIQLSLMEFLESSVSFKESTYGLKKVSWICMECTYQRKL